jgi:hypothetical protein
MKNKIFTGIGCFAKPDRLGRIFNKLVENYTLGPFNTNQLFDGSNSDGSDNADLLQALMAGFAGGGGSGDCETQNFNRSKKITGFYLSLKDQKLNLSIFASGNNSRPEIITRSLDTLSRIRQKRLN